MSIYGAFLYGFLVIVLLHLCSELSILPDSQRIDYSKKFWSFFLSWYQSSVMKVESLEHFSKKIIQWWIGRKIQQRIGFYPLMLSRWNFPDCWFTVLSFFSQRKILFFEHYRKKCSEFKKKSMWQKILILS